MAGDTAPLAPPPSGWTVDDVDALPDTGLSYELVDGVPTVMSPPKLKHQQARRRLANALEQAAPPDLVVVEQVGVILGLDQRPIPDIVVIRGFESTNGELSNFQADRVVLVAEVVARSSRSDDRFRKPGLYAQSLIMSYLRIELEPPQAVAYRLGPDGPYVQVDRAEPGEQLTLVEPFPVSIDPAALLA